MGVPADPPDPSPTDGRPDAAPVRPALPRGMVVLLGTASAIVIAAGLRSIAWLIGPVFLALIIVIAVAPVERWFQRHGWPRWAITLVLVLAVYAVVVALAMTVVISIARLATTLPEYAAQSKALAQSATNLLARFDVSPEQLRHIVDSLDIGKLVGLLGAFLGSIAGLASNLVFILRCCSSSASRPAAPPPGSASSPQTVPPSAKRWATSPTAPASTWSSRPCSA